MIFKDVPFNTPFQFAFEAGSNWIMIKPLKYLYTDQEGIIYIQYNKKFKDFSIHIWDDPNRECVLVKDSILLE